MEKKWRPWAHPKSSEPLEGPANSRRSRLRLAPCLVSRPRRGRGFGFRPRPVFLSLGLAGTGSLSEASLASVAERVAFEGRGPFAVRVAESAVPLRRTTARRFDAWSGGPSPSAAPGRWGPTPAALRKEFHFNPAGLSPALPGTLLCRGNPAVGRAVRGGWV